MFKVIKVIKDTKGSKASKGIKESKGSKGTKDSKDTKGFTDIKDIKGTKEKQALHLDVGRVGKMTPTCRYLIPMEIHIVYLLQPTPRGGSRVVLQRTPAIFLPA